MLWEAKLGRHISASVPNFTLSRLLPCRRAMRNVLPIRISRWRVLPGWVVSSPSPAFSPPCGILKRLRVGRKLNAKDRRIRRVSLCCPALFIWPALCAVYATRAARVITTTGLRPFASTAPSLVTKLSLRGASKRMTTRKFSLEWVRVRYTRI